MSRKTANPENLPDVGQLARSPSPLVAPRTTPPPFPDLRFAGISAADDDVVPRPTPPFPDLGFAGISAADEEPYGDLSLLPDFLADSGDRGLFEEEGASGTLVDIDLLWRQSLEKQIRQIRLEEQMKREMIAREEGVALNRIISKSTDFFQLFASFPQKLHQAMREERESRKACAKHERDARNHILGNFSADLIDIISADYQSKIRLEKRRYAQLNAATIKDQFTASYVYYCQNDFQSALQLISEVGYPYPNLRALVIVTMCRFNCGSLDSLTRLLNALHPFDLDQLGKSNLEEHAEFFAMVCEITMHLVKQAPDSVDYATASRNLIAALFRLFVTFAEVSCSAELFSRYALIDSLEQTSSDLISRNEQLTYFSDPWRTVNEAWIAKTKNALALKQITNLIKDLKDLAKHCDALIAHHQQNPNRPHKTISGSVKLICQLNGATFHLAVPRGLLVSLGYFVAHSVNMENVKIQAVLALIARALRKNGPNISPSVLPRLFRAIQVEATRASAASVICLQ
jgi:hypothetical protein